MPELRGFLDTAVTTGGWVEARVDHVGSLAEPGNPFANSPWRHSAGGLWDVGPHAVALVVPALGAVTEVAAMAGPHDMTHVLLRHSSEAISTLTLSVDVPPAAAREESVFAGDSGVAVAPQPPWDPPRAYRIALDELLAAAAGGPRPEMDVRFGAEVTAVLAAAVEAIGTGRTVTLQR
jgi:predicted dehydrogenase